MKAIINGKEYNLASFTVAVRKNNGGESHDDLCNRVDKVRDELSFVENENLRLIGIWPGRYDPLQPSRHTKYLLGFEDVSLL